MKKWDFFWLQIEVDMNSAFFFFFAILFFVLCFSKIPDLRRLHIHLSCLIILWSRTHP